LSRDERGREAAVTDCENIRVQLVAHHEGELEAGERRLVEAHLSACPDCARDAGLIREVLARVEALPVPEPPVGSWQAFEAAVRRRIAGEAPHRPGLWGRLTSVLQGLFLLRPVPALAAATALGLLLAVGLVRTQRSPREVPPAEVLVLNEDLAIGQDLEVLESLDFLEDIEVLERLELLQQLDGGRRPRLS